MAKKKTKKLVTAREGKCLLAVKECSLIGLDPSPSAVALILRGEEGVPQCASFKTYGCLLSASTRKIKSMLTILQKRKLLSSYSPPPYVECYLLLSEQGEQIAEELATKTIRKADKKPVKPLFNERK